MQVEGKSVTARTAAPEPRILLTGATGYIGGRLRAAESTEIAQGDALHEESVTRAC